MKSTVKFKNLTIHYSDQSYIDIQGEGEYSFCDAAIDDVKSYVKEQDIAGSYEAPFLAQWIEDDYSDTITDIDLAISIMQCLIDNCEGEYTIHAEYEHIIWLFHDLKHAEYDFEDFNVSISDYEEERAIRASIERLSENNIAIPYNILHQTVTDYQERFGSYNDFVGYAQSLDNSQLPATINLS